MIIQNVLFLIHVPKLIGFTFTRNVCMYVCVWEFSSNDVHNYRLITWSIFCFCSYSSLAPVRHNFSFHSLGMLAHCITSCLSDNSSDGSNKHHKIIIFCGDIDCIKQMKERENERESRKEKRRRNKRPNNKPYI